MKKIALFFLVCLSYMFSQAQVAVIYTNDGHCEMLQGSSVDGLYPANAEDGLCIRLLDGRTVVLDNSSVDSIVVTNRTLAVSTGDASNITRNSATLSGSIGWNIASAVGFLLSENDNPTIENSVVVEAEYGTAFTAELHDLSMTTTYYYKAFAYVSGEYYYGSTEQFTTVGYAVGDLYPNDENPIGVVFYVYANGTHGKIVSLTHAANLKWDSRDPMYITDTGGYNTIDGSQNPMIYNYSPVQQWIVDTLGEGWYCPATGELSAICNHITEVNGALESHGYNQHNIMAWSSTQYNGAMAYNYCVGYSMGYSNGYNSYVTKGNIRDVIGVKKF